MKKYILPSTLKEKKYWNKEWVKIFDRYQQDVRHAYYIKAILESHEKKILEIGAGSFRDTVALNNCGRDCIGIDFSEKSVELAKNRYPNLKDKFLQMDAFKLDFQDKEFDFSFHNGFWGCFEDHKIKLLAKEQARVTNKRMSVLVHNSHNKKFVSYFEKMSEMDDLYKLRFFSKDEIIDLMSEVCSKIKIIPVGKGKKYGEDKLIRLGFGSPKILRYYFKFVGGRYLENSERLMCVGYL